MNFKISEFNITGDPIPQDVADKILLYHISPMQVVRDLMNIPIWSSLKSGYRPVWWELQKNRSGNSEHAFKGKGAVDWTCADFLDNKSYFLENILRHTTYTRIAIYDTFLHCDYKHTESGRREVYTSDDNSNWVFLRYAATLFNTTSNTL